MEKSQAAAIAWFVAEEADELRAKLDAGHVQDSVLSLFLLATGDPDWANATSLAERARIILRVLNANGLLQALIQADLDSGRLHLEGTETDAWDENPRRGGHRGRHQDGVSPAADEQDDVKSDGDTFDDVPRRGRGEEFETLPGSDEEGAESESRPPESDESGGENGKVLPPTSWARAHEAEVVETWLNAELPSVDTSQPLLIDEEYVLALSFGARVQGALKSVHTALNFPSRSTPETDHLDLTIQLLSDDFRTPPLPQAIRVKRDGTSEGRCLFEITPIKTGPAVIRARVEFAGNWVQQLDLRFDVAGAEANGSPAADVKVKEYGRPLNPRMAYTPRVASMTFTPDMGGYKLFVRGVTEEEVFLRITPNELDAAISKVRSELLSVVSDPRFAHNLDVPEDLQAQALKKLAFAGLLLFTRIFNSPFSSPELQKVGAWLRDLPEDVPVLQVVSNGFPVPWALLYPADKLDDEKLDWANFVGMRHVIEQIPMRDDIRVAPPPVTIESAPALAVRVLYNDGIDETMPSHPVAAQRDYWNACRGVSLAEGTTAEDLIHTALAPGSADKVLYFYCHAVGSNKNPDDSRLEFSGGEKVTLGSLWAYAPIHEQLAGNPLVFINACESGRMSPLFYNDFVPYFLGKGARGVIGTEAKIPGLFASEWAKAFFSRFFAGETLGNVVLGLRREFLAEHGNPLGLLYGVHCDTDTRIAPALYAEPLHS